MAQGNLDEALKSFKQGLAIRERLAEADTENPAWQRGLSMSYDRVGDVLVAQGSLAEALKSFRSELAIADRLAKADPGNAGGSATCRCPTPKLATCWWRKARCPRR